MFVFIIAQDGTKLMPTSNMKKVRGWLNEGTVEIYRHDPLTVRLLRESGKETQPVALTEDTGYGTMGLSLKSEKHEFISEEDTFLKTEKQKHDDRKKYRRTRRNRKRYRAPRFDNRKVTKPEGWIAPSLRNKAENHVARAKRYAEVCPITTMDLEMGQFDTQVLKAVEKGEPLPEGTDYQHGPRYGYDTLREAVFARDKYKCICCKRSGIPSGAKPGVILRMHHLGFKTGDRSNRMDNLATVCTECHTPANHQPGGLLYKMRPKVKKFSGAAFMNTVKWYIYRRFQEEFPDAEIRICYGAATKRERLNRHIAKSHANDAYCIGEFHPKHRCHTAYYTKARRHNRVLTKFHDAKYIDARDGSIKKGAQLPNGRTNRNHKKDTENLRKYRRQRVEKGYFTLRTAEYEFKPGDAVKYKGMVYAVDGAKSNGDAVALIRKDKKVSPSTNSVSLIRKTNGWKRML